MISINDLVFISNDLWNTSEASEQREDGPVYESEHEDAESSDAYFSEETTEVTYITEQRLARNSFMHARSFKSDQQLEWKKISSTLVSENIQQFRGIYLDTCANRSSVMSYDQYKEYCMDFEVTFRLNRGNIEPSAGNGGSQRTMGTATIPIPFTDLNIIIAVTFQIRRVSIPSWPSMKDMVENGLELIIQRKVLLFGNLEQKQSFENFFLIHRWEPNNTIYSLYSESELKKLHRIFGYPSVTAVGNLL